jgi:glutathione synthase/RimK-type ligase-like ATP-grasp enzyme
MPAEPLKIALATGAAWAGLTPDDRLLADELARRGAGTTAAVWDAPDVRWDAFDAIVIRSCWDYHLRPQAFLDWASSLDAGETSLWNPARLVRTNAHKSYLRGLEAAGVPLLPTAWLERGARPDLGRLLADRGWTRAVVKPAVSASAHRTALVERDAAPHAVDALLAAGDVLVQEFAPELTRAGEWSFVFLDGRYSHAVLKRPAAGDYRVQVEWGGSEQPQTAAPALVAQAERIVAHVEGPWLYARVDGIERAGRLVLMELELIEPQLFLGAHTGAAARLAEAVLREARRAAERRGVRR